MLIHNAILTGSISLNGSDVSNITGSAEYSASFSSRITNTEATGSTLTSASSSFSTRTTTLEGASGSFSTRVTSLTGQAGSYATTGSNSFKSDQIITGSVSLTGNVTASNALYSGNITAQTLIVQTVTSSVLFSTGSNKIGSTLANVQEITGSLYQTGSIAAFTGNVGIGTNSPTGYSSKILNIFGSASAELHLTTSGSGTAENDGLSIGLRDSDGSAQITLRDSSFMAFGTADSEKMRITSGGSITIGGSTVTDGHLVNVIGNQSSVNVGVVLNNTNSTHARIYGLTNVNSQFSIYDYTANAQRFFINSTGSIGIGSSTVYNGGGFGKVISFYDSAAPAISLVSSTKQFQIGVAGSEYRIYDATSGVNRFIISETGVATFSNDIQGGGDLYFNKASRTTIYPTTTNQNLHIKSNGSGVLQLNNDNTGNLTMCVGGGNVGVGVTSLGSWDSTIKAIEVGTTGNFYGGYSGGASVIYLGANAYYNSGWKYATSGAYKAQLLDAGGGNWHFQNAASGSAGGAITWTSLMKITDTGNLNFYNSTSQLAFYGANNFQINFGMVYNGSNLIATATAGGRIVMTDVGYEFKTFSGITVGNTVTDASRFKITNEGNVGINTSNPINTLGYGLTVEGSSYAPIYFTNSGTSRGYFVGYSGGLIINANTGTLALNNGGSSVLIGTTTDNGYKFQVAGNIYSSGAMYSASSIYAQGGISFQGNMVGDYGYSIGMNSNNQVAANAWYMQISTSWSNNFRFFYGGTGVGAGSAKAQIDTSGNYSALSDINKKKDIVLSTLGLNEILQLKPSTFKFKDDENEEEQIGFIAQEVKDVIPHAYYEDVEGEDKFIGLKYNAIVPVLVKAIQELKAEIEILKNR